MATSAEPRIPASASNTGGVLRTIKKAKQGKAATFSGGRKRNYDDDYDDDEEQPKKRAKTMKSYTSIFPRTMNSEAKPSIPYEGDECPVDWNLSAFDEIRKDKPDWMETYELRQPWKPKPRSFEKIAEEFGVEGKKISETQRKRFKHINFVVHKATGVYYKSSLQGLEGCVPEAAETQEQRLQRKTEEKSYKLASMQAAKRTKWGQEASHQGPFFKFRMFQKIGKDGIEKYPTRLVPAAALEQVSSVAADLIEEKEYKMDITIDDPEVVEAYITTFWPDRKPHLPKVIHSLDHHSGVRVWCDNPITWTEQKLIDLDALAEQMGSDEIRDMVKDHVDGHVYVPNGDVSKKDFCEQHHQHEGGGCYLQLASDSCFDDYYEKLPEERPVGFVERSYVHTVNEDGEDEGGDDE
ncbi:hypothetical protein EJ04DRAFT_594159 [Polyplosphaeria fusca]|uniref:Uncharacterized protein n=1 Tax=Polyplosphaeria fusca TaxID=682080 RepID=A0A9P4V592_9PLEO|nr:hypothetical protein EJ04DRAFT_594159 [Polyplosphaeria fusca]